MVLVGVFSPRTLLVIVGPTVSLLLQVLFSAMFLMIMWLLHIRAYIYIYICVYSTDILSCVCVTVCFMGHMYVPLHVVM